MLSGNWLSNICLSIETQTNVKISDYARQFILQTAVAAQFDPHPDWDARVIKKNEIEDIIVRELTDLANSPSAQRHHVVTYFHVLHWFDGNSRLLSWPVPKL